MHEKRPVGFVYASGRVSEPLTTGAGKKILPGKKIVKWSQKQSREPTARGSHGEEIKPFLVERSPSFRRNQSQQTHTTVVAAYVQIRVRA